MVESKGRSIRDELSVEFGYYPLDCNISGDGFSIQTLPGLKESVATVSDDSRVCGKWRYAGTVHGKPYSDRIFDLPTTHVMTIYGSESREKIDFLVWCMSFFVGMRLTTTEAGFLDATPIKPGVLVDFHLSGNAMVEAIDMCATYFESHRADPVAWQRVEGVIHALFMAQYPKNLEFEKFQYLYMALDACFRSLSDAESCRSHIPHGSRIQWMCGLLGIPVPGWAEHSDKAPASVAAVRNDSFHEALFFGAPLGFSLYGGNQQPLNRTNVILQMQALACRLLVAILGRPEARYVRSSVETRQIFGLDL
ncbi:MAG: hypothetical protein H2067_20385 [Alcanivorax sp.]|nr:hypothetical protein [Alcanivorax sp.]